MALTKFNYNSFDVTPVASKALAFNSDADGLTTAAEGSMVLIETLTADGSGTTVTFDSDIDSTYPIYLFKFINIHPATDDTRLTFQANAAGGSGYNETITSIMWRARNEESGSGPAAEKVTSSDQSQAQGTEFQQL